MKCVFCKAELLDGKDKCDYCGKYQHDHKENNENNQVNNHIKENKTNIGLLIIKILLFFAIVGIGIYFVLQYLDSQKNFYGNWNCPSGDFSLSIDSSTFKMKMSVSNYEEANYILEKENKNDDESKSYYLDVSATKTLINGSTQTNKNITKIQIDFDKSSNDSFILKNLVTNEEYKCYRQAK